MTGCTRFQPHIRPRLFRGMLLSFVGVGGLMLSACGGGGSSTPAPSSDPAQFTGLLKPVTSEEEFLSAMEAAYSSDADARNRSEGEAFPVAAAGGAQEDSGTSASYTTTYTQEVDVDEIDVVKYDGEHLYIVPSQQFSCCYATFTSSTTPTGESDGSQAPEQSPQPAIRILATDSAAATATQVATIPLAEGEYVQGLYILPDKEALLTVGTQNLHMGYGVYWFDLWAWQQQNVRVDYYDVSTASAPGKSWSVELEGGFVDSRRVGDTVYVVSRHTPTLDNIHYYPTTEQEYESNRNAFKSLNSEDLIPKLTIRRGADEQTRPLFAPQDCMITNEGRVSDDRSGYQTLTSITAIAIDDPLNPQTLCYNESAAGVYVSSSAIYLSDVRYGEGESLTRIHKFALGSGKPRYRGSAEIGGYLWTGGQRDFRISEHDGRLRVFTTRWTGDDDDRQDHTLYLLEEADTGESLEIVAQLPNNARPAEIGKPNEGLFGVRFVGDRAYAVTFEQIDPLYVIDLSNPRDPFIAGSMDLPGFSDFLHPIGDDLLLGLGTTADSNSQVKLELFDVSDATSPVSRGVALIGSDDSWNWSEAQYNRHAFSYLAGDNRDRFAVPVQSSGRHTDGDYYNVEALYLFEVNNTLDASAASLDAKGSVQASWPDNPYWYGGYRHRSVIDGDAVYFISGDYVWSALWDTPLQVSGPQ
ncbi:MAG: beta-propeller domain-containing protein [Spongiibacter sp.]|nr:beta-propeller domain-containing protein [Spongiibacter sp.]